MACGHGDRAKFIGIRADSGVNRVIMDAIGQRFAPALDAGGWSHNRARPLAASYFDVDGTLVSTNLVHPTLFYLLNQATPVQTALRFGRALLRAPAMGVAEMADRRTFNELLYSSYGGMSEDRLVLLSDVDGSVAEAFGVAGSGGLFAQRWTFYVDRDGVIRAIDTSVDSGNAGPDIARKLGELGFPRKK